MNGRAVAALVRKEFLDVSRNKGALFPVILVTAIAVIVPFVVTILIPAVIGERLSDDSDLVGISEVVDSGSGLTQDGRVQLFLFQQFLLLFLLTPTTGAMATAAHAVIGEKQARTLEPLLATPVSTLELLLAKVMGALVPTFVIAMAGLTLYVAGIALFALPGVLGAMVNLRTAVLVFLLGPASALLSLQGAILISSRVNDARTAQQFGVFIVIPITGLLVAQFTGALWLSAFALTAIAAGLMLIWAVLAAVSVRLFDRETILTRWR
jgi:ABC-2 type transport system permease protein